MSFDIFNLSEDLNKAIRKNNYLKPTNIQELVIPIIKNKQNIIAQSQTGSGKTASFVLPLLDLFQSYETIKKPKIKILILTPTRELAIQIAQTFINFSEFIDKKPKIATIIGGQSIGDQLLTIQKGCDIVVGTTGRILDIIDKKQINLSNVEHFILDEADKMLDLGFYDQLDMILSQLPNTKQNLMFSATYPPKVLNIASKISNDFIKIISEDKITNKEKILQRAIMINKHNRSALLRKLITQNKFKSVLVFMANKRSTDNIAMKFRKYGFLCDSFHGDLTQDERNYTLKQFKTKKLNILFSTDIASRGLHIDDIDCVINFDLPRSTDDYIHRIGRTARAGKDGTAISFLDDDNIDHFKLIEKRNSLSVSKEIIDEFGFIKSEKKETKNKGPIKGKRKSKKDKLRENITK
ncbi:MAG: DEAD/DEAH box helicase [Campylobacterota bacterium]|nr:DEAD/DEAH box helicase [Campylobacterota bacterium]